MSRRAITRMTRLLSSLTLAAAVGACSSNPVHPPIVVGTTYPSAPDTTLDPQAAPLPAPVAGAGAVLPKAANPGRALPTVVSIPAIGVNTSDIVFTGLDHGAPAVPPTSKPQQLASYAFGAAPCTNGPATVPTVFLGHIDGGGFHGVFYHLQDLKAGAVVTVKLNNGASCQYRITKLASFDKKKLASDGAASAAAREIWGPVPPGAGVIRIISCGGQFVGAPLYYSSNIVGEGVLVG